MEIRVLFALFYSLCLFSCGRGKETSATGGNPPYQPLSLEESKLLVTPTIYYIPQFDLRTSKCDKASQKKFLNQKSEVIVQACENVYKSCLLQGTCSLITSTKSFLLNVSVKTNNEYRFAILDVGDCKFGRGVENICLDPFYTLAADNKIYPPGTVIFIPKVRGLRLPNGTTHQGYFIVRDTGQAMRGYGRFDFFTGYSPLDKRVNPFALAGLGDKSTHFNYYVLDEGDSEEFLKLRNFPKLP